MLKVKVTEYFSVCLVKSIRENMHHVICPRNGSHTKVIFKKNTCTFPGLASNLKSSGLRLQIEAPMNIWCARLSESALTTMILFEGKLEGFEFSTITKPFKFIDKKSKVKHS